VEVYTNPLPEVPPAECVEAAATACKDEGGECVWQCDPSKNECKTDLCVANTAAGVADGDCSCKLPPPKCKEADATACADAEGTCVDDCDPTTHRCKPELCVAHLASTGIKDEDCACELAFNGECPNWFIAVVDFFLGWFFKLLGIDLCPGGGW